MPVHQEVRQSMEALKHQLWRQIMRMWCCYSWCAQHVSEDDNMWEATNNMLPEDMFFWGKKQKLMLHA